MAKPVYDQAQVIRALTTSDGTADSTAWKRDQISYSLSSPVIAEGESYYSPYYEGYVPLTAFMEAQARAAFQLWDDLVDVELIELPELAEQELDLRANILFNRSTVTDDGLSFTLLMVTDDPNPPRSTETIVDAEIWFAADDPALDDDADYALGLTGFLAQLHHIGHAIGLTHGGPYNVDPDYAAEATHAQDTLQYTVMSPFPAGADGSGADHGGAYPTTPLLHDIAAAQALYGADLTTRTGDTTYGFNSTAGRAAFDFTQNTRPVVAIWDAGGTDTLDLSGFTGNQTIDLAEGGFSSAGGLTNNIAIAWGAEIENAVGGSGNDVIRGNALANRLAGGGGDDDLEGGAGGDTLIGGSGTDRAVYAGAAIGLLADLEQPEKNTHDAAGESYDGIEGLVGSALADVLRGDAGPNPLAGGGGADVLEGRAGNDRLEGEGGNDWLRGGTGDDRLDGGSGDDRLVGGPGADTLIGGTGIDAVDYIDSVEGVRVNLDHTRWNAGDATGDSFDGIEDIVASNRSDTIIGNSGDNTIWGAGSSDTLRGRGGDDHLLGGGGHDRLEGEWGDDLLEGGRGNDDLEGGPGADALIGGVGVDRVSYRDAAAGVRVNLPESWRNAGEAAGDTYSSIEDVEGSAHADVIQADAGRNALRGGAGDDVILGHDGNDRLFGDAGDDRLEGGAGNDDLTGGPGADKLIGGAGTDRMLYSDAASGVQVDLSFPERNKGEAAGDLYDAIEVLVGSDHRDVLRGNSLGNVIEGGDGNDLLDGREARDVLAGGDGNDLLLGGNARDRLSGGRGRDELVGGDGNDSLAGGGAPDRFVFNDRDDRDTVWDFELGIDTLVLDRNLWRGSTLSPQEVVDRFARIEGDFLYFDFGGGDSIRLAGIGTPDLASDIQIA